MYVYYKIVKKHCLNQIHFYFNLFKFIIYFKVKQMCGSAHLSSKWTEYLVAWPSTSCYWTWHLGPTLSSHWTQCLPMTQGGQFAPPIVHDTLTLLLPFDTIIAGLPAPPNWHETLWPTCSSHWTRHDRVTVCDINTLCK